MRHSAGGCDMARHSVAERSHPTSEVRGRSWKDPMPEERRPRGVTPCPRSGAAAESTRLRQCRNGREELPGVRGRGGGGAERRYPVSEVRGNGLEELPHAPTPEARGGDERSYPEPWLRGHRRA